MQPAQLLKRRVVAATTQVRLLVRTFDEFYDVWLKRLVRKASWSGSAAA